MVRRNSTPLARKCLKRTDDGGGDLEVLRATTSHTAHTASVGEQIHRALTGPLTEAVTSLFAERGSCKPLGRALPQQPEKVAAAAVPLALHR